MAGIINCYCGYQRSGKTLLAVLHAYELYQQGIPVYTNMYVKGWYHIRSLLDVPLDFKPKVLLLDEAYYFLDSRQWQSKKDDMSSLFFYTIGKQEILLQLTAVSPDTIEKRLRQQLNYMFISRNVHEKYIEYLSIDVQRGSERYFALEKNPELFQMLNYNTKQIPGYVDCNMVAFAEKVNAVNEKLYRDWLVESGQV